MHPLFRSLLCASLLLPGASSPAQVAAVSTPRVYYSDSSRLGRPFAKDPSVIRFHDRYLMYYSIPPQPQGQGKGEEHGWGVGIAESRDLVHWTRVGDMATTQSVAKKGIAAPGARVIRGKVHLFYQTYGNGSMDAICHAVSSDGIHFTEDPTNPVYHPTHMPWSVGRAIDPEVYIDESAGKAYLFFATRDPSMRFQMLGLAEADLGSGFGAGSWRDVSTSAPILKPTLPWEQLCIEAPTVMKHGDRFYLFYAGAYNNAPQQIGVAESKDLVHWTRLSSQPFLANGKPGTWNSSESGHPGVLQNGDRTYLFFQGNNDHGKTYFISRADIVWKNGIPYPRMP